MSRSIHDRSLTASVAPQRARLVQVGELASLARQAAEENDAALIGTSDAPLLSHRVSRLVRMVPRAKPLSVNRTIPRRHLA